MGPQLAGTYRKKPGLRSRSGPGVRMSMAGGSARALPLDFSLRVGFCRQSRFLSDLLGWFLHLFMLHCAD